MSSRYGHGPLAEGVAAEEFAKLIQHIERRELRFAGCRGECMQGRLECTAPGQCYIAPAESSTEVGADQADPARSMHHYEGVRNALLALGIVAAVSSAAILAVHLAARMGWLT